MVFFARRRGIWVVYGSVYDKGSTTVRTQCQDKVNKRQNLKASSSKQKETNKL